MEVLGDLPAYIPFNEPGICFARALYMSMALASKEIPSSAYFVFPKQPGQTLNGINGMPWQYHVAMMIRANDSEEQMIFDPAFSEQPMVDSKWISLMSQEEVKTVIVPGSQYAQEILRGANIPPKFINSFDELPPFKLYDIENACSMIERFQNLITGSSYEEKKAKLYSETIRMVHKLEAVGKLKRINNPNGQTIYCGRKKIFDVE